MAQKRVQVILITGLSGAGKSSVAKCLEDLGYYCLDNLPVTLLRDLLEAPREHIPAADRIAVVTDARTPGLAETLPELLAGVDRAAIDPFVLFLDTSDEVLLRRYSETRRRHPLAPSGLVSEGIQRERQALEDVRALADKVMNTSEWTIHEIRRQIDQEFGDRRADQAGLTVNLISFGFKRGIPPGSDLLFDVRYLPNPYFVPELRLLSGLDREIVEFLRSKPEFGELEERLFKLLEFLLPNFSRELRSYLTIGIGCTGGRHRSVAMAEALASRLAAANWNVRISHRDVIRHEQTDASPVGETVTAPDTDRR